jgi:hypothetical protein
MLRVMRTGGILIFTVLVLLAGAPVVAAQPVDLSDLVTDQLYRAPGAVATLDEARVRAVLRPEDRVLLAPFDAVDGVDDRRLREWAGEHGVRLLVVEGLAARVVGGPSYRAPDRASLRRLALYADVTPGVLDLLGRDSRVSVPEPVKPSREQVAALAARLREADRKVLTLPGPAPGDPHVDYASSLAREFPDELVMVVQGRWFDVAAPDQDAAEQARDYLFGRWYTEIFRDGASVDTAAGALAARYDAFRAPARRPFAAPAEPGYDLWGDIRPVALWTTLIAGVFFCVLYLAALPVRRSAPLVHRPGELRLARAETNARISELGRRLLDVETGGKAVDPAAAERLVTARRLFDEAHTIPALVEVRKIADEGMALVARQDGIQ